MSDIDWAFLSDDDWAFQYGQAGLQQLVEGELKGLVDGLEFRRHMSLFATGVAVITTQDEHGEVSGATVNSFGSISVDPPTVMVSLRQGRTLDNIVKTGRYGASILSEAQQVHSAHFAGNREKTERPELQVRDALPTLNDCLAWFECEVIQMIEIHDHVLFPAQVTACGSIDGDPLIFFASKYHARRHEVEA